MTVGAKALPLQQFLEQLQRGCFVPPRLDQHIEHFAFAVDGPVGRKSPIGRFRLMKPGAKLSRWAHKI